MTTTRPMLVLATLVCALSVALCGFAYGQEAPAVPAATTPVPAATTAPAVAAPAGDFKLGVVDIDRVQGEFGEVKSAAETVDGMESSLVATLQLRNRNKLLVPQELDELVKLSALDKPTEVDKKRFDELQKKSTDQAALLESLRSKKDLTEQEKVTLKEMSDRDTQATTDIAAKRAEFATQVQAKQKELLGGLTQKINATVATIAQEKGLSLVISKELVLFGGLDITDDLLTKLNGKDAKKP